MAEPIADTDRIAVRRRARGAADRDAAASAGDVLDHHGLAERDRQMIGKDTRDRVGDPAGRYGHDDGDGARWIGLCPRNLGPRNPRDGRERDSARCQRQKPTARKFHSGPDCLCKRRLSRAANNSRALRSGVRTGFA